MNVNGRFLIVNGITRQICNGWKAGRTLASVVLREDIGKVGAKLAR
jgi:hypothetical protein